jgi:cell division protein FtsB
VKKKLLKYCKNKYTITVVVFLVWIVFFDQLRIAEFITQKTVNKRIGDEIEFFNKEAMELERQLQYKDNKDSVEKYARENYYMKRENEIIYLFD